MAGSCWPGKVILANMKRYVKAPITVLVVFLLLAASCASTKPYTQALMKTPEILTEGDVDPFGGYKGWSDEDSLGVLYATNRVPAPDGEAVPYLNERDTFLHLGIAEIAVGDGEVNWESIRDIEELNASSESYPLSVQSITPFGPLEESLHALVDASRLPEDRSAPGKQFAEIINSHLAENPVKDIFIYVHGVNTAFESPLLVASQLWHFLGYRGAFIAFSWPSDQKIVKYIADVDTAEYSATMFRVFLEYLRDNTDAERIHLLAYSAGTKLASQALYQYGLLEQNRVETDPDATRIGRVLFTAGDVERQLFGLYATHGLLDPIDSLTVYMSSSDNALSTSESIRKYPRLGQYWGDEGPSTEVRDFVRSSGKLEFVDVTGLEGTKDGSGHWYFTSSSWVSSDVLANLGLGIPPGQRGLVLKDNQMNWSFPDDYIERLRFALDQRAFERDLMETASP